MSKNKPRTYDKEFKLNAINLYLTRGRTYDQVSDELIDAYWAWSLSWRKPPVSDFCFTKGECYGLMRILISKCLKTLIYSELQPKTITWMSLLKNEGVTGK
ncbi:MAG: hypothetical protein ACD_45C00473G0007 [uncultured bacterium]|nr:MAG: hypothetical protein ACD_45C00473G0007 [uncultured bacterium]